MTHKKNIQQKKTSFKNQKVVKPQAQVQPKEQKKPTYNKLYILVPLLLTVIVYSGSLNNGWIKNWDDGGYVTEIGNNNSLSAKNIHDLSGEHLNKIFTTFYKGNYHPLTTLVYAFEYIIVGDSPFLYHLINLIFHLINVYLVFVLLKLLTKRVEIAAIAAALFGIHPMHVESVAWVSELKDVMYTFFFLLSMIQYYYYYTRKEKKRKYYILSIIYFLLSMFSKSAAVTLPVVLLLVDYFLARKWSWKILYEKIPFFLISMIFGVTALYSQGSAGAIQDIAPLFTVPERLLLASTATITYIWKLFVPIHLSAMYPYPDRIEGHLPLFYYIAPVILLIVVFLVFYSKKFGRDIIFGTLFFIVTISLVIQLLPVGGALVAERYSYVPYIGFFLIIGKGYIFSQEDTSQFAKKIKIAYPVVLIALTLFISFLSFQRITMWKDGKVLFTCVIKEYPNLPFAYNNRGYFNFSFGEDYYKDIYKKAGYNDSKTMSYDSALADYNKSIAMDTTYQQAYSNRGVLYYNFAFNFKNKDSIYLLAIKDFDKAMKYKPDNTDALTGRAKTYATLKMFDKALQDYNTYISLKKNAKDFDNDTYRCRAIAYYSLGVLCLDWGSKDSAKTYFDKALSDINTSIEKTPSNSDNFFQRGYIYLQMKEYKTAMTDFDKSITMSPKQFLPLFWRGFTNYQLKNYQEALNDYTAAIDVNSSDPSTYINRSEIYKELGRYEDVVKDYTKVIELNPANATAYSKRAYAYFMLGKTNLAEADKVKSISLGAVQ